MTKALWILRLSAVILVIAGFRWAVLQKQSERYEVQESESGLEIAADPQEAAREVRPRPHLSLQVVSFTADGRDMTFSVRLSNSGSPSAVKAWHVFVVSRGRSYGAVVRKAFGVQIVQGSPRNGFISLTAPNLDLSGATWNIGFQDDAGLWNWMRFRQPRQVAYDRSG